MADLDQERADLNALIREAHEAMKDLRRLTKDADDRIATAEKMTKAFEVVMNDFARKVMVVADENIAELVDTRTARMVEDYLEELNKNLDLVKEAIYARFDAMGEELTSGMGKTAWDDLPLPDYLRTKRGEG